MVGQANNRYALFREDDDKKPAIRSPIDVSGNPFLNQVADDDTPWEEVKKRGAPREDRSVQRGAKTLNIKDQNKAILNRALLPNSRDRAISLSTADSSDKFYDPHANWCGICSQKFPGKSALLSHIKQSPRHENYCNLCKRVFKDRNGLKNHVDNSWGHDIFCNLCLSAFKDTWGLKNHLENNYNVGHEFVCPTCLLGFQSHVELGEHLQTAEKHTWCKTCSRRFHTQDERDQHWRKTHSECRNYLHTSPTLLSSESNLTLVPEHRHCLEVGCDFDCADEAALIQHHMNDHFQCQGCKLILPSLTKLNLHYESCSHSLSCPQCQESCAGSVQLAQHLTQCFLCEQCGFQTFHEGNFKIVCISTTLKRISCGA
ncbi:hypothetical protein J1614_001371 [Plenodomus biglobosus]|nr:hypothetical protein J1614_001371 [Plenodomus biglobosus]